MQSSENTFRRRLTAWGVHYRKSFSFVGLVFATLFFAASVTPSLLPRHFAVQGVLSGFALASGYGIGTGMVWIWNFWELPNPGGKLESYSKRVSAVSTGLIFLASLRQMTFWQNSIRRLMEMPELESAYPYRTGLIAIVTGALIIGLARLFSFFFRAISMRLRRFLPPRIAYAISATVVAFLTLTVIDGVFAKSLLRLADASFAELDELIEENVRQPVRPDSSGSEMSLIPWDTIGRRGKHFIVRGPTKEELQEFAGDSVMQPLRVYVGLRTRPTLEERAHLALEELKRTGAFERSVLIVATPTGTGWLDPSAVDTVEYLHRGDTAIVSIQYSYLPSWLTILVDPNYSRRASRALFDEVYGYWKTLPKERRPRFYLHGLSLGALGSEASADLFTIFEDPTHGALWSGPPFPSTQWETLTRERNEDSPAWRPEIRDGAMVRFTGQENRLAGSRRWGPIRSVYLQYASDPMTFFSPDLLWHEPAWMRKPRGPDVSPHLQWYPVVTFLQIAFDLPMATSVPLGHGHNYAPVHYINGWLAVTAPEGWRDADIARLKQHFKDRVPPAF